MVIQQCPSRALIPRPRCTANAHVKHIETSDSHGCDEKAVRSCQDAVSAKRFVDNRFKSTFGGSPVDDHLARCTHPDVVIVERYSVDRVIACENCGRFHAESVAGAIAEQYSAVVGAEAIAACPWAIAGPNNLFIWNSISLVRRQGCVHIGFPLMSRLHCAIVNNPFAAIRFNARGGIALLGGCGGS